MHAAGCICQPIILNEKTERPDQVTEKSLMFSQLESPVGKVESFESATPVQNELVHHCAQVAKSLTEKLHDDKTSYR